MSNNKGRVLDNSLTDLAAGVAVASNVLSGTPVTGGSTLSSYGTIAHSNNYSLLTLNRIILTYMYTGNGIFQTAIELPVQDALSKGIDIISPEMDSDEINAVLEWMDTPFNDNMDSSTPWETISNMFIWGRLYGGSGLIINTDQNPEEPLDLNALSKSRIEMYDIDRWQMDYNAYMYKDDLHLADSAWVNREFYHIHGIKIHKSRIIRSRGKRAPYFVRRQLKGWGMSEGERMIRDINAFLKTQDVMYEIMDEAKVDVYKIKNLASKLIQRGGVEKITNRVMVANELKNYINALVLDTEEEFQQKTLAFSGMAEVMRENRLGVAAALRIPMTKLFGISASGFNTGESDLENYNMMVESCVRAPLRPIVKHVLEIGMAHLFGYVPKFSFSFPSLRVVSAMDEENLKVSAQNRAIGLYDRGILDSKEVGQLGKKEGWLGIDTNAGQGLLPPQPEPPGQDFATDSYKKKVKKPEVSKEVLDNPFSGERKFL